MTALAIDPAARPATAGWGSPRPAAGSGAPTTRSPPTSQWIAPPDDLPTTAFGSLYFDAAARRALRRLGRAERLERLRGRPRPVQVDRLRRHRGRWCRAARRWRPTARSARSRSTRATPTRSTSARRSPATAPRRSTAGGGRRRTRRRSASTARPTAAQTLHARAGPRPTRRRRTRPPPETGLDFFAGRGLEAAVDPNHPDQLYAAVFGYGALAGRPVGRRPDLGAGLPHDEPERLHRPGRVHRRLGRRRDRVRLRRPRRRRRGSSSATPPTTGRSTATTRRRRRGPGATTTRSSATRRAPAAERPDGRHFNNGDGWIELSSADPADPGFAVYNYCQNGQCSYDSLVAHPPGSAPARSGTWRSMNYDELKVYDRYGLGAPPRSNGRAVIRSTNAGGAVRGERPGRT